MISFSIGTANKSKVQTAQRVIQAILKEESFTIGGFSVESGVPETPWNEETKQGALNRAIAVMKEQGPDYAVGIESGLVERYGDVYEEAWCCITDGKVVTFGYSSGLRLPNIVVEVMNTKKVEHNQAMKLLREEFGHPNNRDTWGNYSDNTLLRSISFEEALRNALVQIFASSSSLYNK